MRTAQSAMQHAKYKRVAVRALTFAAFLIIATFWNSQIPAQQTDPKPAEPDKTTSPEGASAQPPANGTTQHLNPVRVNVVNVPVSVLGKNGLPVIDLTQNDFEVYEDGQPQAIKYFMRGSRPPLRIGLIMDTSNSARRQFQFQKDAASEFVFNMLRGRSTKNKMFLETF